MSRSSRGVECARAAAAIFVVVLSQGASTASPSTEWDQKLVTGIAEKLARSFDTLYDEYYEEPDSYGTGGGESHHQFMDVLRRLQHETAHLAATLARGASAEATVGSVKYVDELNDDLAEYGRMISFEKPVIGQIAACEDLIRQLAPYYGLDAKH